MSEVSTVYLCAPAAPRDRSHLSGYIDRHDERGVWVADRQDRRGETVFFPAHLILRIEHNTGWR